METDLRRRYEQRMEPLAILLASIAGIYQRYGYAVVSTNVRYNIDPRWIGFAPSVPPSPGTWRQGTKDELPLLERMYREFSGPRNGYLHRAPVVWDGQVFGVGPSFGWDVGPSLIAIYEEGGEPKGYVTYAAKHLESGKDGGPPGQRVWVRDFVWNTTGAYRGLWEMLRNFDLASRVIFFHQPKDDPAFDLMLNPRELNASHGDALLGRIIDLERVLPLRPYGHEGKVTFEVRDEMCPWNAGRWALEAGADGRAVTRTKEAPQLTMDVSTLVQLLFGQLSPSHAVRWGRAEASPDAPLPLWDAMWRTEHAPFCPDGF
jgi:predicted acetyltransferase